MFIILYTYKYLNILLYSIFLYIYFIFFFICFYIYILSVLFESGKYYFFPFFFLFCFSQFLYPSILFLFFYSFTFFFSLWMYGVLIFLFFYFTDYYITILISIYISIREIYQRIICKGRFTYVTSLILNKAYYSVPIFNIITKFFHFGICEKCFDFISKLYLTSKARAPYFDMLSNEFRINHDVWQIFPLPIILFNLFINDF